MGEVIQFPKSAHKNFPMVSMLETMLERAKKGELKFLAFAALSTSDGNAISAWTPDGLEEAELTSAIGAVSFLHARFMDNVVTGCLNADSVDGLDDPPDAA